jgi:hypothetical protein
VRPIRKVGLALGVTGLFFVGAELLLRVVGWPALPEVDASSFEHNEVFWIDEANQDDRDRLHGERTFRLPRLVGPDGVERPPCEGEQDKVDALSTEYASTFSVSSDENGLRAPNHPLEATGDTFRIMAMGCSTTFGWGVEDNETWPARLEEYLRTSGYDNVEVINAGQPGYSSYQGVQFWEEVGSSYAPDLVILSYVIQDSRKVAYSDLSQAILQDRGALLKQGILYRSSLYQGMKIALGDFTFTPQNCIDDRGEESSRCEYRVDEEQYLHNLRTLRASIEQSGADVMHFAFPEEVAMGHSRQHRRLLGIEADFAEIPFFDPSVEIERVVREGQVLYGWQAPNPTFDVEGDCLVLNPNPRRVDLGHANAAGLDRIAQLMSIFLEENDLLVER